MDSQEKSYLREWSTILVSCFHHYNLFPIWIFFSIFTISASTHNLTLHSQPLVAPFSNHCWLSKGWFVHMIPFAQKRTLNIYHSISQVVLHQAYLSDYPHQDNQQFPALQIELFISTFVTPILLPHLTGLFPLPPHDYILFIFQNQLKKPSYY